MAKNWSAAEAARVVVEGTDKAAIQDIGRRFPLFLASASRGQEGLLEIIQTLNPDRITVRIIEKVLKEDVEDMPEDSEDEAATEEKPASKKAPSGKKSKGGKKKSKPVEEEPEEDEDWDEDDAEEEDEDEEEVEEKPKKKKKSAPKNKKSKGGKKKKKPEPVEEEDDEDEDDDEWDL